MRPCVYILASALHGTLYVGVTSNLARRVWEHKTGASDGFACKHGVHRLVFAEYHANMEQAILREKRIKKWRRDGKIRLIETENAHWDDLHHAVAP